jgi:predicted SprT family Zn-dependent metalloprotease
LVIVFSSSMNLYETAHLAKQLMREHGLTAAGWSFGFDHAKRRFGRCNYTRKLITLSRPLVLLNAFDEVRDTILHEIAHALVPGTGHGPKWRLTCVRIGARPRRCYDDASVVSPPRRVARYEMGCTSCGWWVTRYRRTARKYACKKCRGRVTLRERARVVEWSSALGPSVCG